MAATAPAPAAFVLVSEANAELGRYTTKGSANRAAKKHGYAEVIAVADWDAQNEQAEADPIAAPDGLPSDDVEAVSDDEWAAMMDEEHLASEGFVPAGGAPEVTEDAAEEAPYADTDGMVAVGGTGDEAPAPKRRLAAASKKLSRDQKRALAACVRAAMAEVIDNAAACSPLLEDASADDVRAQVEQWMSYLPKGADEAAEAE